MKKILLGIAAVLIITLIFIAFLPQETHIERTLQINASPELAFSQAVDLRTFHKWSPWSGLDPNAKYEFSDPSSGVGATMSWSGNDTVGVGAMVISEVIENYGIELELDFGPQGIATATWVFEENGSGTQATWAFDTHHGLNPISRVIGAFFMDGMIGPDFEKGLQNLKERCEQLPSTEQ